MAEQQQQQQQHRGGHIDPTAVSSICENLMRVVEQLHSTTPSRHEESHFHTQPGPSSSGPSSSGQSHLAWVASSRTPPAPQPRRSFPSGSAIAGQLFKSGQSSSAIFDRKGKRRRIDPCEKWTHNFICLADSGQQCVPNISEKGRLQMGGLGEKNVELQVEYDLDVQLYSYFEKLRDAGGYKLLIQGQNCCLELLPIPPNGYTVAYLKSLISHAKIISDPFKRILNSMTQ